MNYRVRLFALVFLAALLFAACSLPGTSGTPAGEDNAAQTAGAETALAAIVQTQLAQVTPVLAASATHDLSVTEPPTLTPTATQSPTPTTPEVSVSVDTNCRVGPSKVYDYLGALVVGEKAQVLGRDPGNGYWYVRLSSGVMCWVWGEYATVTGDVSLLPIFTPPPTPTPPPDFSVEYSYLESCVGWDPGFKVTNTGGVTFKSYYVKVRDTVTNEVQDEYGNNFDRRTGCTVSEAIPSLPQGKTGWIYANSFVANPTGHLMKAEIKLCTEINQAGVCINKSLDFTP